MEAAGLARAVAEERHRDPVVAASSVDASASPRASGRLPATTPVAVTKPTSGAAMCIEPPLPPQ